MVASEREIYILLHNIRSVYNVGAIFRTADAIGISKIFLTGYTPTPLDRFGNFRGDFAKCSLGAERDILWKWVKTPANIIDEFKKKGFQIISAEQSKDSLDYKKIKPEQKCVVIFGTEVSGVSKSILKKSDVIAEIPMRGKKESLNVSISAGIVLYRWFDQ